MIRGAPQPREVESQALSELLALAAVEVAADFLMRPARALDDGCLEAVAGELERERRAGQTAPDRDGIEAPHALD